MGLVKRNVIANMISNFWSAFMSLFFLPLYIHFLGIEAYGLVGVFIIMQTISSVLDKGVGTTLNREMARLSIATDKAQSMRDLLRSLEIVYWIIGLLVVIIIFLAAPYVSHKWIQGKEISPGLIEQALIIMGGAVALQGVAGFYSAGLLGLQRQVLLNGVDIFISTLRGAGAVIVLWLISPTIEAFFVWQIAVGLLQVFILAYSLWHIIPKSGLRAVFKPTLLKDIWHFAAGISGITIESVILSQADKVILSRLLSLDIFGYYVLASTVAMGLYRLISPVSSAVYPRLTQLAVLGDEKKLALFYHQSAQLMSVLILPVATIVAFFSREVLFLWKQNPVTVEHTYLLLSILIVGAALNGLMNIPYALQLAFGWTKLTFVLHLLAIVALVPLTFYLTSLYGAIGGACVWAILNSFSLLLCVNIMHRRLLRNEKWHWYLEDIGRPLVISVLVAFMGRVLLNSSLPFFQLLIYLFTLSLLAFFMSVIVATHMRGKLLSSLSKFKFAI